MTAEIETRVREAATALHDAILDARAAGLRVTWPAAPAALPNIAISATAAAAPTVEPPGTASEPAADFALAYNKAKRNRTIR